MTERVLNDWLESTVKKAHRIVEDADRKTFAARAFQGLILQVHGVLTTNAVRAERPNIERFQSDDQVTLRMEWQDRKSGWYLNFDVLRVLGEKPRVRLAMSGNPKDYACEKPTPEEVRRAVLDYFEAWKS